MFWIRKLDGVRNKHEYSQKSTELNHTAVPDEHDLDQVIIRLCLCHFVGLTPSEDFVGFPRFFLVFVGNPMKLWQRIFSVTRRLFSRLKVEVEQALERKMMM